MYRARGRQIANTLATITAATHTTQKICTQTFSFISAALLRSEACLYFDRSADDLTSPDPDDLHSQVVRPGWMEFGGRGSFLGGGDGTGSFSVITPS
jgi:hypothetical protein